MKEFIILSAFVLVSLGTYLWYRFKKQPENRKKHFDKNPGLLTRWMYTGEIMKMRKLRITSVSPRLPIAAEVGFLQGNGYLFFGRVRSMSDTAVIETYLGEAGCQFVFATASKRELSVELLPEDDISVPDAIFRKWFWQK